MSNSAFLPLDPVLEMRSYWAVITPLMEGTMAMREAGPALLPQFQGEDNVAYAQRLGASTLLPAYSETVGNMTSRVFAEPLQLGDTVPEAIKEDCKDADMAGNDLNSWAVGYFKEGLSHGLCHAFVDYQAAPTGLTVAQEKARGLRPYLVMVKPEQILGWRSERGVLTMVRYFEAIEEESGDFGVDIVEQVRVLTPGAWAVYRKDDKGREFVHDSGTTNMDKLPWVTFYTGRIGVMRARPPLMELAFQNVKHWQSQSDQDNILHVIRVPILARTGMPQGMGPNGVPTAQPFKVGAGVITDLPASGKLEYVEHSGQAVTAGRDALKDLIEDMRMSGAKMLAPQATGTKTATQAEEEAAQEISPLARMATQFTDCLNQILQFMADYRGLGDGGTVELRGNFDVDYMPEVSLPTMLSMVNGGMLSKQTLFAEMQRRGIISDEYDWEDELALIEAQGPALGTV